MKRTALLAAWLVIGLAGLTAQTKTVDVLKDESTITYRINHTLHHIEATSKDGWFRVDIDPDKHCQASP